MEYFQVRYNSRVVIYECKMFIRLATRNLVDSRFTCLTNFFSAEIWRESRMKLPKNLPIHCCNPFLPFIPGNNLDACFEAHPPCLKKRCLAFFGKSSFLTIDGSNWIKIWVEALVQWSWEETQVPKVVGSNTGTLYKMDTFSDIIVVKMVIRSSLIGLETLTSLLLIKTSRAVKQFVFFKPVIFPSLFPQNGGTLLTFSTSLLAQRLNAEQCKIAN